MDGNGRTRRSLAVVVSLVALLLLSAVPAQAQVDEWRTMEQERHRSGVHLAVDQITGNVDAVRFWAGYTRTTGTFRYVARVYCDDGQSWTESGRARDTRNRYWRSQIFDLSDVASNVPCNATLDVNAVRALRGNVMFGAIVGHFYQ
jgi:hypothetical protein